VKEILIIHLNSKVNDTRKIEKNIWKFCVILITTENETTDKQGKRKQTEVNYDI
jgi:hypothetical protein